MCSFITRQSLYLTKDPHSFLSASAVTKPLPKVLPDSGFNQPWFRYLWCVPGTKTYLFLNNGRLEPPPITYNDVGGALEQALARVQDNLTQDGDGPVKYPYNGGTTPDYTWYLTAPSTNMRVGVAPSKGTLTWGILGAAMTGLWQYANAGYDFGDYLILYQINDGEWGTVGVGYVGFVDPNDPEEKCVYQDVQGNVGYCNDVTGWKVIR